MKTNFSRRKFLLSLGALAASVQFAKLFPLRALNNSPSSDGVVMVDGWILLESDL